MIGWRSLKSLEMVSAYSKDKVNRLGCTINMFVKFLYNVRRCCPMHRESLCAFTSVLIIGGISAFGVLRNFHADLFYQIYNICKKYIWNTRCLAVK